MDAATIADRYPQFGVRIVHGELALVPPGEVHHALTPEAWRPHRLADVRVAGAQTFGSAIDPYGSTPA
ncbi:hypothetical protein EV188_104455 [Actinomycetospora succinea]|uniref:Uncharacterized protein n=1 Tax=Actinomycetospora succinea TaxID=663603 RepID=A0A4R6VE03_9PSEU|nr:hypothetical protein [Actinomycetospora succinea]TDQ58708.1 hypothetical protein EV188_104455 [Actinomycetospora succinea]